MDSMDSNLSIEKVKGVYAKSLFYSEDDLLIDATDPSMEKYVFKQSGVNWFGVTFFGIWSYNKNSNYEIVRIPVRQLNDKGKMISKKGNADCPRSVWTTNKDDSVSADSGFEHYPTSDRKHTEECFIDYIKKKDTQEALWKYFIKKSEHIKHQDRKLSFIGFNCFSTNDACDKCLDALYELKTSGLEYLPPKKVGSQSEYVIATDNFPIPLLVTYKSKQFYHPELGNYDNLANNGVFSASLLFKPSFMVRLKKKNEKYESDVVLNRKETIKHRDEIKIEDNENIDYVVLMVDKGKPLEVETNV